MGMMLSRKRRNAAKASGNSTLPAPESDAKAYLDQEAEVQADLELETSLPPESETPSHEDTSGKGKKGKGR